MYPDGLTLETTVRRDTRGFTLIELLIVVVIIGILAAIGITNFGNSKERAMVAAMKTDLRTIDTASLKARVDELRRYL